MLIDDKSKIPTAPSRLVKKTREFKLGVNHVLFSGVRNTQLDRLSNMFDLTREIQSRPFISPVKRGSFCDWRDEGVVAPPGNQGDVSACVSFSVCAVAHARAKISGFSPPDLAPFYFHFSDMELDIYQGTGMPDCSKILKERGLPYWVAGVDSVRNKSACDALPKPDRLSISAISSFKSIEEVKREIYLKGPVVCVVEVYLDFFDWQGNGVYRPTTSELPTDHAMAIIGYNDDEEYWIVKNSRGTNWGGKGFFLYDYQSSGLMTSNPDVWALDL